MIFREICRTPAMYGIADVLCGADENRKNDHKDAREAMVKSIYEVIIITDIDTCDLTNSTQYAKIKKVIYN